jgi:hypothetical protein
MPTNYFLYNHQYGAESRNYSHGGGVGFGIMFLEINNQIFNQTLMWCSSCILHG